MSSQVTEPSASSALTPVQAQAVIALAQGTTITAAAAANLHRGTIYKWLNTQKEFEEAVRQARTDYILTLRDELKDLSGIALATLRTLLTDASSPPAVRMRVALAKQVAVIELDYKRRSTKPPSTAPNLSPSRRQKATLSTPSTDCRLSPLEHNPQPLAPSRGARPARPTLQSSEEACLLPRNSGGRSSGSSSS